MGKKNRQIFPLPNDSGHDFEDDDLLLTYRPTIEYVGPPQEFLDNEDTAISEEGTLDDLRTKTEDLVKGYDAVAKLADLAQKRIDDRVTATGGLDVRLDPLNDAATIAAIKRTFPDKDPNIITYDMYKKALNCINKNAPEIPGVTPQDIRTAKSDPYRTNFGGLGTLPGENRAEVASPAKSLKPINTVVFQAAAVAALFKLLLPMIQQQDQMAISQHLITTPHV